MANVVWLIIGLVGGVAIGAVVAWLAARAGTAATSERLRNAEVQAAAGVNDLRAERATSAQLRVDAERAKATLESERKNFEEQRALIGEQEKQLREAFSTLASEALQKNSAEFLKLAGTKLDAQTSEAGKDIELKKAAVESLVNPLADTLKRLQQQVAEVSGTQKDLKSETSKLVSALRSPIHRGRWGEVQLKRVVELAGMVERCDFHEQLSFEADSGGKQRPDMTIHLPNGREIVVDSKVAFDAFYEAMSSEDDTIRNAKLKQHASQVKQHLSRLSSKAYWAGLDCTPEFVVAFLPGEVFFSAALQQDPSLIEFGAEQRVILATPTTLIALLKAVAYGWRQEQLTEHALQIQELGRTMYERLWRFVQKLDNVRNRIDQSVKAFDESVGTLNNLLQPANKFRELGAAVGDEILPLDTIEKTPRELPEKREPVVQMKLKKLAAAAGEESGEE
jgi:DNA recombination protein RmuC